MRHISPPDDPSQNGLFDIEQCSWWYTQLDPAALRRLENKIEGFMRKSILKLMPAQEIGKSFDPEAGRLSKELYAICGLLLLAEFYNWTIEQAVDAWCFNSAVQFVLNLPHNKQYLCKRTVDNYRKVLREDEQAQKIFEEVTAEIVRQLNLTISKQRLDSTHLFSDMAQFGRLKLLAVTVKRFLVQLKRHDPKSYAALPQELKERYASSESRLFGMGSKKQQSYEKSIAEIAEDIGLLLTRFGEEKAIAGRSSFKALARVFSEHCEVKKSKVIVKPKASDKNGQSSQVLQNPSDVDAGYDGHKGPGYQVQIAQAYDTGEKAPGIITACVPQSVAVSDAASLKPVYEQQTRMGTMPKVFLADTGYGSQAHADMSTEKGVKFYSPVAGKMVKAAKATSKEGTPKSKAPDGKEVRLNNRRLEQETEEWKSEYRKRSGLEGVHAALDRVTRIKRLQVRGAVAVNMSVYLKVTGWNIRTAAAIINKRRKLAEKQDKMGKLAGFSSKRDRHFELRGCRRTSFGVSPEIFRQKSPLFPNFRFCVRILKAILAPCAAARFLLKNSYVRVAY